MSAGRKLARQKQQRKVKDFAQRVTRFGPEAQRLYEWATLLGVAMWINSRPVWHRFWLAGAVVLGALRAKDIIPKVTAADATRENVPSTAALEADPCN